MEANYESLYCSNVAEMIQYDTFRLKRTTSCRNLDIQLAQFSDRNGNCILGLMIQYDTV